MKKVIHWFALVILTSGFAPAATIVFDNDFGGVISGDNSSVDGYPIFNSVTISNSFVLSTNASLTGINLLVDEISGFPVSTVDWSILDDGNPTHPRAGESGVNTLASGPAAATVTFVKSVTLSGIPVDIDELSFSISTPTLVDGTTYWLQIGTGTNQTDIYWDQSDGPSTAYEEGGLNLAGLAPCNGPCTDSESFQLLAVNSPVPEPGSLSLLVCGLAAIVAFHRHQRLKNW